MRFVIFGLIMGISMFGRGIAEENMIDNVRVQLNPGNISINEEGIFLRTDSFGEIALNNLQHDERGCYTICSIGYFCTECRMQVERNADDCIYCGAKNIETIGMGEDRCDEYLTAQAIVCSFLDNPLNWENKIYFSANGKLKSTGSADDEGNQQATIEYERQNDNGNARARVRGKVSRDKNGKVKKSGEFEIEIDL